MRDAERKSRPFAKKLRKEMTEAELRLWSRLRRPPNADTKFRRQHPVGPFVADFACVATRLIVELDGATHSTDAELAHDTRREIYVRDAGWRVLRFTNEDVRFGIEQVMDAIWQAMEGG